MVNYSKLAPEKSWSKWEIALIVSVPVTLGIGYWIFTRIKANEELPDIDIIEGKNEKINGNANSIKENLISKKKEPKIESPIEMAEMIKNQGNEFFKSNNYNEAIRCYSEAIQICPEYEKHTLATFYQNRAAAHEKNDDTEKTIEDCSNALLMNCRYLKAITRRAKAAEKVGKLDLAMADLATACFIDGFRSQELVSEFDRVAKLSAVYSAEKFLKNHVPRLPSKFFIKSYITTYKQGSVIDLVDATDENNKLIVKKFEEAKDTLFNGNCEKTEKKCKELIILCEERGDDNLKYEAILLLGTFYTLSKQNEKAIEHLSDVITKEEIDDRLKINALIKRATVYQHQGDTEKANNDFDAAIKINPNNVDIYHQRAQIRLISNDLRGAIENFSKAIDLDGECPITRVQHCYSGYKLAMLDEDKRKEEKYSREFKKILDKFPDSVECITLYAQVLVEKQKFLEAQRLFELAIGREPKHAALYVHKALLELQWQAEVDKAKALIKQALELDEDCEFAYETLATIEMQTGNFTEAVKYFDEAIPRFTSPDELMHLYCVRNTAEAQSKAVSRLNLGFQG